jgi:phospholipid N-methyltransferase
MDRRFGPLGSGIFMVRQFLRDWRIASLKSTSPYLVNRICDRLDLSGDRVVVEYGPGLGCFTRALLERLSPGSTLVAIETHDEFVRRLSQVRDSRLKIAPRSAEGVKEILGRAGVPAADVVLSGIPFSLIPEGPKLRILEDTRAVLGKGGVFVAYQSSAHLERYLKQVFRRVRVDWEFCHIPPLAVLDARAA